MLTILAGLAIAATLIALVLVAALGGYELFGFFGVICGPVPMVLPMTTIDVNGTYYADRGQPANASDARTRQAGVTRPKSA
jgi:predicted PurR-regulated permease PerM